MGLGGELLDAVAEALFRIRQNPEVYARVHRELRRVVVRRFPFGVFFVLEPERIVVTAVLHLARHPRTWRVRARADR